MRAQYAHSPLKPTPTLLVFPCDLTTTRWCAVLPQPQELLRRLERAASLTPRRREAIAAAAVFATAVFDAAAVFAAANQLPSTTESLISALTHAIASVGASASAVTHECT